MGVLLPWAVATPFVIMAGTSSFELQTVRNKINDEDAVTHTEQLTHIFKNKLLKYVNVTASKDIRSYIRYHGNHFFEPCFSLVQKGLPW